MIHLSKKTIDVYLAPNGNNDNVGKKLKQTAIEWGEVT